MGFQKYNIKEKKQKEKGKKKKKATRIIKKTKKQTNTNNHPKTIYGVCLKKKSLFLNINNRL